MFATTVNELVTLFRSEVNDRDKFDGDPDSLLWKPADVLAYFNEGLNRVLKRTEALYREIPLKVTAGQRLVRLPASVRHIREARLRSTFSPLREVNTNDPARYMSASDYGLPTLTLNASPGEPSAYTRDFSAKGLLLNTVPVADDFIDIQCSVILTEPLTLEDDLPITDDEDQRLVITYMKYRAYAQHDVETYDLQRSTQYRAEFDRDLAERVADLRSVRRAPGTVRMEWP